MKFFDVKYRLNDGLQRKPRLKAAGLLIGGILAINAIAYGVTNIPSSHHYNVHKADNNSLTVEDKPKGPTTSPSAPSTGNEAAGNGSAGLAATTGGGGAGGGSASPTQSGGTAPASGGGSGSTSPAPIVGGRGGGDSSGGGGGSSCPCQTIGGVTEPVINTLLTTLP